MSSGDPPDRVLFETLANDGRYMSWRRSEHVPELRELDVDCAEVPRERARSFGDTAPEGFGVDPARIPLFPGVAAFLADASMRTARLGSAYPSSSIRTVYPEERTGLGGWALKLHLPDGMRARYGKNLASKEIGAADAVIGPVFTALLRGLDSQSPYLGVVEEPYAVVAEIGGGEVGAVFRRLPPVRWIPGFSLYSANRGRLRKALGRRPVGLGIVEASLGPRASRLERVDRCLEVFVDPLLDIFFSLASQGVTLQLHAQNVLFEIDRASNRTAKVWVRDLAGVNYAPEYRASRALPDLLPAALASVPGATDALVSSWFRRRGTLKRAFEERFLFGHAYDAQLSAFLYQLMTGFWRAGFFRTRDLALFQIAVQRRAHAAATHHDFDPTLLRPLATPREGLLGAVLRGLELRAIFRPSPG